MRPYLPTSAERPPPGLMVNHSIDNGNLQFVKLIGVGTYGEVYHTVDRRSGESYAVKVLPRKHLAPQRSTTDTPFVDARLLSREVALYARIPPHSNIIRLERMLHTQDQLFMVMEHCSGGDLYENISKNPYFHLPGNDALIRRLFLQLVSAIAHCHKHGVYHRDIKPENVLVSHDGLNVKLIDFGLSTNEPWCREIGCGSAYYMSPECQGGVSTPVDQYAAAPNDVWALGIILINLATGRNPWNRAHTSDALFNRFIADKSFLCKAIRATPTFEHIIRRVLDLNPATRCTLDELYMLVKNCTRFVGQPASQPLSPPGIRQSVAADSAAAVPAPAAATAVAAAASPVKTHQKRPAYQLWFPNGLAGPHALPTPNAAAAPSPNGHMRQAAEVFLQPPNNRPPVEVAQTAGAGHPRQQQQQPAESMSFSSSDSIFDPLSAPHHHPLGYPPLNTPGFGKGTPAANNGAVFECPAGFIRPDGLVCTATDGN
ncbi:Serine/threonine protein kinase [Coemansia sp. RSA 2711]|nr:Serine/threonine protein kinase [Coemansia sp. RSA 2711]